MSIHVVEEEGLVGGARVREALDVDGLLRALGPPALYVALVAALALGRHLNDGVVACIAPDSDVVAAGAQPRAGHEPVVRVPLAEAEQAVATVGPEPGVRAFSAGTRVDAS